MRYLIIAISSFFCIETHAGVVLSIEQVADGIYVHQGKHEWPDHKNHGAIANIGFIVGERCVAVIDTGGNPEEGKSLKRAIAKTTGKPICYVINTHVHPDHIFGNIAFKEPGTQFVGHHKLARAMAARGQFYIDKAEDQIGMALSAEHIIPPDIEVEKTLLLDLGGRELLLTAHPTAHTDNDLSIYDQKTDTLWLGDLFFIGHLPTLDGSLKGWLAELMELERKSFKQVIPGHGPVVTDWPKSLEPQKRYLGTLLTEIRKMIRNGKFIEDAIEQVGYEFKGEWLLFDEFHKKNVTAAFAELEWED